MLIGDGQGNPVGYIGDGAEEGVAEMTINRRIAAEKPILFSADMVRAILDGRKTVTRRLVGRDLPSGPFTHVAPGDIAWVREAWRTLPKYDHLTPTQLPREATIFYMADWSDDVDRLGRYRNARFMCRWMSRLDLPVLDVRPERVQDITEEEIIREGVTVPLVAELTGVPWSSMPELYDAWRELWDHLHGPGAWLRNDWVWRIEFER